MEERLTDLELRYMQQEKIIQELNDTVYRQELTIVRLERDMTLLREQVMMLAPSASGSPEDEEPPPHY